jgi:NADH-ubiquinone oxidoreductase chain 5
MYLLPLILTFFSFFICFFRGRLMDGTHAGLFSSHILVIALQCSCYICYEVCFCGGVAYYELGDWISTMKIEVMWIFTFDSLTSIMLVVILFVSTCAHIYSVEYMQHDPHQTRFMSYLSLFTFFMIMLVMSSNTVILFMGWEGVGICSYLLINFWYTRIGANKSALMAMYVNKVGDISLLIASALIYSIFYTFDYSIVFMQLGQDLTIYMAPEMSSCMNTLYFICLLLTIGAVGKSAQLGLHTWLPEAMEGPTPVSSLIHAATMVTAGIFVIIRFGIMFQYTPTIYILLVGVGSCTAFLGSTIGIYQQDIKKIIAYSTCSQLGYMFLACGLSGYQFSMYHLVNHAFFKALLFLTAGYLIHALNNEQDIRRFGGLITLLPFAYICTILGSLSLLGFPFFSGFFSKEKIIELFYGEGRVFEVQMQSRGPLAILSDNLFSYNSTVFFQLLASISVTFTVLYSIKILLYVFIYSYRNNRSVLTDIHYSSHLTTIPLLMLSFLSVCSGFLLEDMMVGISSDFWGIALPSVATYNTSVVSGHPEMAIYTNLHHFEYNELSARLPIIAILYSLFMSAYLGISYYPYYFILKLNSSWTTHVTHAVSKKYVYLNKNLFYPLINVLLRTSYVSMYKYGDKGIVEFLGPYGISKSIRALVHITSQMQTGFIYHYSGFILVGLALCTASLGI